MQWLEEDGMEFDFKFIMITTFMHSMEALKSQSPDI